MKISQKTKENEPGHCIAMEMMMALMWWASFFSHRNIYLLNGVFALTFAQDIPKISHSHSHQKRFVIGRVKWSGITSTVLASGLVVSEDEGWMDDEHDWNNAKQWNVQTVDLGKRQDSHGQPGLVLFLPLCENSFILTKNRETNWQCHCWVTSPHCHHHHRKENCSRLLCRPSCHCKALHDEMMNGHVNMLSIMSIMYTRWMAEGEGLWK